MRAGWGRGTRVSGLLCLGCVTTWAGASGGPAGAGACEVELLLATRAPTLQCGGRKRGCMACRGGGGE